MYFIIKPNNVLMIKPYSTILFLNLIPIQLLDFENLVQQNFSRSV